MLIADSLEKLVFKHTSEIECLYDSSLDGELSVGFLSLIRLYFGEQHVLYEIIQFSGFIIAF